MILSPDKRKIPTNKSLQNVLSEPGICGLPVPVRPPGTSTATATATSSQMNRGTGLHSHPTPSSHDPELLTKNTAELASQTANEWSSILRNIPHSPPELSVVSSTRMKRREEKEKKRLREREKVTGSALDQQEQGEGELGESKCDVKRVSRKGTPIKDGVGGGKENEEEEKQNRGFADSPLRHPPPHSSPITTAMTASVAPFAASAVTCSSVHSASSTLEIIPISLQDSASEKYQSPTGEPPYPLRQASRPSPAGLVPAVAAAGAERQRLHEGEEDSSDEDEDEETTDYGSGYDDESAVQRLSSASDWSLSPEPKHLPSLRHKTSGSSHPNDLSSSSSAAPGSVPPLHSSYSMSKSSYSMHQSMYQSLSHSHSHSTSLPSPGHHEPSSPSSPLPSHHPHPHAHAPTRRRSSAEYTPSTLLANMLTLPDNITTSSLPYPPSSPSDPSSLSCGCLPNSWRSKGNAVHVELINEPLHDSSSLSPHGAPPLLPPPLTSAASSSANPPTQRDQAPHTGRRSYSYLPTWMRWTTRRRHPQQPSRAGSYHYTMASLRSSVSPDIVTTNPNSGVEI
jgi:hypothetical protein